MSHDPTNYGMEGDTPPAHACQYSQELTDLRRRIRDELIDALDSTMLTVNQVDHVLDGVGLPPLPYRWTVRLRPAFTCEVTATGSAQAIATARALVDDAVDAIPAPIDVHWSHVDQDEAEPQAVDMSALEPDPRPGQSATGSLPVAGGAGCAAPTSTRS